MHFFKLINFVVKQKIFFEFIDLKVIIKNNLSKINCPLLYKEDRLK